MKEKTTTNNNSMNFDIYNKLSNEEMQLLAGTEAAVTMLRNKISLYVEEGQHMEAYALHTYVNSNATDLWHKTNLSTPSTGVVNYYFLATEDFVNVQTFLSKNANNL